MHDKLDKVKIEGKTIIPSCTRDGSGLGSATRKLAKAVPKTKVVQDGLNLRGATVQRDAAATEEAVVFGGTGNFPFRNS